MPTACAERTDDIHALTSYLLDDELTDAQYEQLAERLETSDDDRAAYVESMWLHALLIEHYQGDRLRQKTIGWLRDAPAA